MSPLFFVYEFFQKIFFHLIQIFALKSKNKKFLRFVELRNPENFIKQSEALFQKWRDLKHPHGPVYWFHVSSAGEMEQAIPIAKKFFEELDALFFVTYYSPSAEPFLKNFPNMIDAIGLPIDLHLCYEKVFQNLPIQKIFFVRYDLWPSLIYSCQKNQVEMFLLNATRLKTRSVLKNWISNCFNKKIYQKFSHIFAVSNEDVLFFQRFLPQDKVHLAGDAKWARAYERTLQFSIKSKDNIILSNLLMLKKEKGKGKKVIVVGSPHDEEQRIILNLAKHKEKFLIVYAPHDVSAEAGISATKEQFESAGYGVFLASHIDKRNQIEFDTSIDLVLLDVMGILAEVYGLADVAIVGGGFDGQVHNTLEAAAHGVPVLIGNKHFRAPEVQTLVDSKAAFAFENPNQLFQFLSHWVSLNPSVNDSDCQLACARSAATNLFHHLPDTSEVIYRVILDR